MLHSSGQDRLNGNHIIKGFLNRNKSAHFFLKPSIIILLSLYYLFMCALSC